MSATTARIWRFVDSRAVLQKRRANFEFLLERLKDISSIKPLYQDLPNGVCPLFFPILVDDRDVLQTRLYSKGIATFVFGRQLYPLLPTEQFPWAVRYAQQNLCLPIHQDLNRRHLAYIADVLLEEVRVYEDRTFHQ